MSGLSKAQRERLERERDEWTQQPVGWRAGVVFLRLEDRGLVEWQQRPRGDVSCGPGYHGSDWFTRRTPAGRAALEPKP